MRYPTCIGPTGPRAYLTFLRTAIETAFTTRRGRHLELKISACHQMLMRGTKEYAMHQHPFTLLQIEVADATGKQVWRPMWLIVIGSIRAELTIRPLQ
jgi:hypothetical protein